MKFNQVIWDALERAAIVAYSTDTKHFIAALEAYAADCDGQARLTLSFGRVRKAEFIPNPIPKY